MVTNVPIRRNDFWLVICLVMIYGNVVLKVDSMLTLGLWIFVKLIVFYFLFVRNVKKGRIEIVKINCSAHFILAIITVVLFKRLFLWELVPVNLKNLFHVLDDKDGIIMWLLENADMAISCFYICIALMCVDMFGMHRKGFKRYHASDLLIPVCHGLMYGFESGLRIGFCMGFLAAIYYTYYFSLWRSTGKIYAIVLIAHFL